MGDLSSFNEEAARHSPSETRGAKEMANDTQHENEPENRAGSSDTCEGRAASLSSWASPMRTRSASPATNNLQNGSHLADSGNHATVPEGGSSWESINSSPTRNTTVGRRTPESR